MLRAAVKADGLAIRADPEPELGSDHHRVAHRSECRADDLLIAIKAIDLCRIEKGDAPVDCGAEQGDSLILGWPVTLGEIQSHAAKADGRNLGATLAECARLHILSPMLWCRSWDGNFRRCALAVQFGLPVSHIYQCGCALQLTCLCNAIHKR